MIVCDECGYRAARFGIKRRCVRCGSNFARSEQVDRIFFKGGAQIHEQATYSPYFKSMIDKGWTYRGHFHIDTPYASIEAGE